MVSDEARRDEIKPQSQQSQHAQVNRAEGREKERLIQQAQGEPGCCDSCTIF